MIGIVVLALFGTVVGVTVLAVAVKVFCTQWMTLRRKFRAMQCGLPYGVFLEQYQPLQPTNAWREPLEFEATKPCPHCGFIHTHLMMPPIKGDHQDAATGVC